MRKIKAVDLGLRSKNGWVREGNMGKNKKLTNERKIYQALQRLGNKKEMPEYFW